MNHARARISIALLGASLVAACANGSPRLTTGGPPVDRTANPTVIATAAPSSTGAAATPIRVLDFLLDPRDVSVVGPIVALAVTNQGPTIHNLALRDASGTVLIETRDLREGELETITVQLASGTYGLFCSLPGHESLGIVGTLEVTAP